MAETGEFWAYIDWLVTGCKIVIDRPKGSAHPRYPSVIYPVDYGYLEGTTAADGGGIDVWVGSRGMPDVQPDAAPGWETPRADASIVDAAICTVDLLKRDVEIKLLIGCTCAEKETILRLHNEHTMRGLLIERKPPDH